MNESAAAGKMNRDEIAKAICSATKEVFTTMLDLPIGSGDLQAEASATSRASGIVALLGLAGEWVGTGRISCSPEFGCKMASQLLMQSFTAVNEEVLDAVGEVANIIIGNVKNALEERLGNLSLSTPTVIYGHNFEARNVGVRERIDINFASDDDLLSVQLSISPATSKASPRQQIQDHVPALA